LNKGFIALPGNPQHFEHGRFKRQFLGVGCANDMNTLLARADSQFHNCQYVTIRAACSQAMAVGELCMRHFRSGAGLSQVQCCRGPPTSYFCSCDEIEALQGNRDALARKWYKCQRKAPVRMHEDTEFQGVDSTGS